MKVALYTLGCKVNQYESRALLEQLVDLGYEEVKSGADLCIINTCAVTAESERKGRQTVRRAQKENPGAYILVTGCAVQIDRAAYEAIPGVDYVSGNRVKNKLVELARTFAQSGKKTKGALVRDLAGCGYERMRVGASERTRAYMKVEDGCESKCAYCIIPAARGPIVSRPLDDCVDEAKRLIAAGYREIVLTGIEISAYGADLQNIGLCDLISALDALPGLERIRLSSIDPSYLRPQVIERLKKCKKLAHHFHLSLQSGCDRTLAAMRRKYNTEIARRNIEALRAAFPDVRFTADVIVGFPGERDEDFDETCAFLSSLPGMLHVHVFAYSRRPGTEADGMPDQVPEQIKRARSEKLITLCEANEQKTLEAEVGKRETVLFEGGKKGWAVGHTQNFIEVRVQGDKKLTDELRTVLLKECRNGYIWGELIEDEEQN